MLGWLGRQHSIELGSGGVNSDGNLEWKEYKCVKNSTPPIFDSTFSPSLLPLTMILVAALNAGELTPAIFSKREKLSRKRKQIPTLFYWDFVTPLENFVVGFH